MLISSNYSKIPNIIIRSGLAPNSKAVLCYLLSFSEAYPSYGVMQEALGLSRQSVWRSIKDLVARHIITYAQGSNLKHQANSYSLLPMEGWFLLGTRGVVPKTNSNKTNRRREEEGVVPIGNHIKLGIIKKQPHTAESRVSIKGKKGLLDYLASYVPGSEIHISIDPNELLPYAIEALPSRPELAQLISELVIAAGKSHLNYYKKYLL